MVSGERFAVNCTQKTVNGKLGRMVVVVVMFVVTVVVGYW